MAILSLDLIHYSNQNRNTGTESPEARNGYGLHLHNSTSNATLRHTTTPTPVIKPRKKILVRKRKTRRRNDTMPAANAITFKKKPSPKSDMQVMQFYAQPVPTFDVSYHPPIYENYNPMVNGILNMNDQPLFTNTPVPSVEPIPFVKPDQLFQPMANNWNLPNNERLQKIPIYDPFNVLKRKPVRIRRPVQVPVTKFLPAARPITAMTTSPPITVTHIYKYEETNSGLKIPFQNDDFVENFPALSVALNGHRGDRASEMARLRGYMTPPKMNQPIYYNMPVVELPTLSPPLQGEYDILHKFNEAIKTQNNSPKDEPSEDEDSKETQEEKNFSDDDVKQALAYIQHLKKNRPSKINRGAKKFNTEKSEGRRSKKGKHDASDESLEEDDDPVDGGKKRSKKPKDFSIEDDDNFKIKSFEELDEEESHKKTVKSKSKPAKADAHKKAEKSNKPVKADKADKAEIDHIKYQESQIVSTLENEVST